MEVLDKHKVKDDARRSTDWTTIGARILEAATLASAIHLQELAGPTAQQCLVRSSRRNRESSDGKGSR